MVGFSFSLIFLICSHTHLHVKISIERHRSFLPLFFVGGPAIRAECLQGLRISKFLLKDTGVFPARYLKMRILLIRWEGCA